MTTEYIPVGMRRETIERSNGICEYCRLPNIAFFPHEVDHVIARKHGGQTELDNLAYACFECNRHKGSDIASIDPDIGLITPLFNPRTQKWHEHFRFQSKLIVPITPEARTTVFLLRLNAPDRIAERQRLKIA